MTTTPVIKTKKKSRILALSLTFGRERSSSKRADHGELDIPMDVEDGLGADDWQPLEGLLSKYTNVMKGWQYRWFVLNPESGRLEYFEKEEHKKQRPRGAVHLAGAVISPSDEDSQTFTVNTANSEAYRLRALDARERQHWVNRLRATAEFHTENIAQNAPPLPKEQRPQNFGSLHSLGTNKLDGSTDNLNASSTSIARSSPKVAKKGSRSQKEDESRSRATSVNSIVNNLGIKVYRNLPLHRSNKPIPVVNVQTADAFRDVKDMLHTCQGQEEELINRIEELPNNGSHINAMDRDILLLKATSKSTLMCLEQCLQILQHQQHVQHQQHSSVISAPPLGLPGGTIEWLDPRNVPINHGSRSAPEPGSPAESYASAADLPMALETASKPQEDTGPLSHDDEVEDEGEYTDTELGGVEEHKSIILHLLSQLKLGMDLTKVVLPTFILEKRSLLEMFADCMAHPDMFVSISDHPDPESRMLAVVEWYLTSFHASRKGAVAKKPYNPIIGEKFYCSWLVNEAKGKGSGSSMNTPQHIQAEQVNGASGKEPIGLYYCAEQVSHHPPISAFYFECPDKKISMNASVWTKSKFMGMSIGVVMVGKVRLNLLQYDEEYQFNLPSAYARSILTVPWVELGDRVTISCTKTNYSASVVFHTKVGVAERLLGLRKKKKHKPSNVGATQLMPFYGGKLHRVSAEIKNPTGEVTCRINGEWNAALEFSFTNGKSKVLDTNKLKTMRKRVRPLEKQYDNESRRLWQKVTDALRNQDIDNATQHKRFLEEKQRQGERHRKETNAPFPTKLFHEVDECWLYNNPLTLGQTTTSII